MTGLLEMVCYTAINPYENYRPKNDSQSHPPPTTRRGGHLQLALRQYWTLHNRLSIPQDPLRLLTRRACPLMSCGVPRHIDEYGFRPLTSEDFFFGAHASTYVR